MKFLVPNYSCLQNPWLGGYRPQIPVLSVLCPQLNLFTPPPKQNSWVRHWWWFQLPLLLLVSLVFTLHMRCISILRSLHFRILSASFSVTYYYDYWLNYALLLLLICRSGSWVAQLLLRLPTGTTTRVSNPGCARDFYLLENRPGCPTKPPIRCKQRFFPGGKAASVWSSSLASIWCWG